LYKKEKKYIIHAFLIHLEKSEELVKQNREITLKYVNSKLIINLKNSKICFLVFLFGWGNI
jgi:hypothetical protein